MLCERYGLVGSTVEPITSQLLHHKPTLEPWKHHTSSPTAITLVPSTYTIAGPGFVEGTLLHDVYIGDVTRVCGHGSERVDEDCASSGNVGAKSRTAHIKLDKFYRLSVDRCWSVVFSHER
jgi:hypothetical protein